jgi:hypothetical protein
LVATLAGCRSQTSTISNPFLAPDRVPPPATRTLLPGTAQPYYPGDPAPTSPAIGVPGPVVGPTNGFPTAPANGWNATPGYTPSPSYTPAPSYTPTPSYTPAPTVQPGGVYPPTSQLPAQYSTPMQVVGATGGFADVTPTYLPNQATPPLVLPVDQPSREVRLRAIPTSQIARANGVASDGFRPQGSSRTTGDIQLAQAVRPAGLDRELLQQYGYDPQYQWLRGKLWRDEASGEWRVRYVAAGGAADQFGGNIAIANPQVLGGLRSGEMVVLEGSFQSPDGFDQRSQPAYVASVVQRQQL